MMAASCAVRMGRAFFELARLVGAINAGLVIMLVMTEMLAGFSVLMLTIRVHDTPAQLESEHDDKHLNEFFQHERIINRKWQL